MKNALTSLKQLKITTAVSWFNAHRVITAAIVVVVLGGGYYVYTTYFASSSATTYTLGTVERGALKSTIDASGQVSALDQIDIKPKVNGDITWVGVKAGDVVYAGQGIAQVDNSDARQAILDAEQTLLESRLQYQKDEAQAPIDFDQAQELLDEAKIDLITEYTDAYTVLSDAYLDLPASMVSAKEALYDYDLSAQQWNIDVLRGSFTDTRDWATMNTLADSAEKNYKTARPAYDTGLLRYKALSRSSSQSEILSFLKETVSTVTLVAATLESDLNLLDTYVDLAKIQNRTIAPTITSLQASLRSELSSTNATLTSLLSEQKALDTAQKTIRDRERSLQVLTIGNPTGANPISLQSSRYSIADQERKIQELKADLADYVLAAPFAGTIATLDLKRFDSVTPNAVVGTLITTERIATLSLNEVDVARLTVGDPAVLTFDAIDDLKVDGSVAEISAVGTVSQGVVSYDIKIAFKQDERVKPGMTVNAAIVVDSKDDVLTIPASAVKTKGERSYVEVFDPELADTAVGKKVTSSQTPIQVDVEVGISDDVRVEVLSGLQEDQQIIVRTTVGTAIDTTTSAPTNSQQRGGLGAPPVRL